MLAFSLCLAPSLALAQAAKPAAAVPAMEAADLALDLKKYVGKRVTVTDCIFVGARIEFAACPILTKAGAAGMVRVDYADDDREIRKRAVDECSTVEANRRCVAEVTGRVRGSATGQVIGLEQARVKFKVP